MKNINLSIVLAGLAVSLSFGSCKNDNQKTTQTHDSNYSGTATESATGMSASDSITADADSSGTSGYGTGNAAPGTAASGENEGIKTTGSGKLENDASGATAQPQ